MNQDIKATANQLKAALIIMIIAILFTTVCRVRLLGVPLERDEGEYAYVAQQLLQGIPPFVSIYHFKLPGIYVAYATILTLFGQTDKAIHFGLLLLNMLTAIVVFFIGKRFFNPLIASLAAACFSLLSLSQIMHGFTANAEHFVLFHTLLGILFLLRAIEFSSKENRKKTFLNFFLSGLLLGISYTMKQHGIFFIVFAVLFFLYKWFMQQPLNWKNLFVQGIAWVSGLVIPLGIICITFLSLGLFEKFWWWTWYYPRSYITQTSIAEGIYYFNFFFIPIAKIFWLLFGLAVLGIISLFIQRKRERTFFTIGLFVFSALSVSVGLHYYPHYFILATPAIALLAAIGSEFIEKLFYKSKILFLKNYFSIVLIFVSLSLFIIKEKSYLFEMDGYMVARTSFMANPFPESLEIAKYLENNTSPNDKIAVLGSEPQIFFYAKRKSATGYLYTYEMMKDNPYARQFQEEMAREIMTNAPKFILFDYYIAGWSDTRNPQPYYYIIKWSEKYVMDNYKQKGIVNIYWPDRRPTDYCWDTEQYPCSPASTVWIGIYERKYAETK